MYQYKLIISPILPFESTYNTHLSNIHFMAFWFFLDHRLFMIYRTSHHRCRPLPHLDMPAPVTRQDRIFSKRDARQGLHMDTLGHHRLQHRHMRPWLCWTHITLVAISMTMTMSMSLTKTSRSRLACQSRGCLEQGRETEASALSIATPVGFVQVQVW